MRYSYKYKRNFVELYRQGKWPETPEGVKESNFHIMEVLLLHLDIPK